MPEHAGLVASPVDLAIQKLNKMHRQLVSDVRECEVLYCDNGMTFYQFSTELLQEIMNEVDISSCHQAFVVGPSQDPELIATLDQVRQMRDESRHRILVKDFEKAEDLLIIAEGIVDDQLKDQLTDLEFLLNRMLRLENNPRRQRRHSDMCLPDPESQPERYLQFRSWLLRLPENQKTLELEAATEDEIVAEALHCYEDRTEDAYEASDTESEISSPPPERPAHFEEADVDLDHVEFDPFDPLTARTPGERRITRAVLDQRLQVLLDRQQAR